MTLFQSLLLGILQGVTEFLPVSSSGHLVLFQTLMGIKETENYILYNVIVHVGTLFAIFSVFHQKIYEVIFRNRQLFLQICLATTPLFFIVLINKPIKQLYRPEYIGFFFLLTSFILYLTIKFKSIKSKQLIQKRKWQNSFIIGIFQMLAIFPGLSRSGTTIASARLLGWPQMSAVEFSFLLSIPAILGGLCLELFELFIEGGNGSPPLRFSLYAIGFLSSFISGLFALKLLIRLAKKDHYEPFIWYTLAIGLFSIVRFTL